MTKHKVRVGVQGSIMPPIENLIKNAQRNEAQGFDSVWWPDHLMGLVPESIWSPDVFEVARYQHSPHVFLDIITAMTVAGMSTKTIGIGSSVTESIRRNPAMLAQAFLSLDHVTKGRVILGLGSGEKENVTPYGLDFSKPVTRLEEALKIIHLLWSTDGPVNFDGSIWKLRNAVLGLRPYGHQPPPIWLAAMGPRMLDLCGRYCDGWMPTTQTAQEYGQKLARIKSIGEQDGRDMSDFTASMSVFVVVDSSHQECHRLLETPAMRAFAMICSADVFRRLGLAHPLGDRYDGMQDFVPTDLSRQEALDVMDRIPFEVSHDCFIHGTPDEIGDLIEQYAQQGLQHIVLNNLTFMPELGKANSSYQGIAQVVRDFAQ